MKKTQLYRQGDVLIERIAKLPAAAKPQKSKGKVILALGEATGHHHYFDAKTASEFDLDGRRCFDVKGRLVRARLPIVRQWKDQVMVDHPTLGKIEFSVADVEIDGSEVLIDGNFGLLTHQEHTALGIPAGLYAMPKTDRGVQREYHPQEIRRVAD